LHKALFEKLIEASDDEKIQLDVSNIGAGEFREDDDEMYIGTYKLCFNPCRINVLQKEMDKFFSFLARAEHLLSQNQVHLVEMAALAHYLFVSILQMNLWQESIILLMRNYNLARMKKLSGVPYLCNGTVQINMVCSLLPRFTSTRWEMATGGWHV
jgi:hypothetical protein